MSTLPEFDPLAGARPDVDTLDCKSLEKFYKDLLLKDVVPFWFPRAYDEAHGGLYHYFDADGTLVDTDKNVWAQGRMAWMLLSTYLQVDKNPNYLKWAEAALKFLDEHCVNEANGRMYFRMADDGTPIHQRRYAFSESFAAIAFAAHAKATGNKESEKKARHWYEVFTTQCFEAGKMEPKFTGKRPAQGLGPRVITINTAQEMRKFLGEDPYWTQWIDRCVKDIKELFIQEDVQAVMEAVSPEGKIIDHCDERTLDCGHAIEGGWFVLEEARLRNKDPQLMELGLKMIDWSFRRGWDREFGGLFYFRDVYNKPIQQYWHNMKFWWQHDESLIASMLAYKLTGNPKYAKMHNMVKDWAFAHFQDRENGEWYGYLERDGTRSNTLKGCNWKSFFHHPRMCLFCAQYAAL